MNRAALVRGSYGALLVLVPDRVVPLLSGQPSSPRTTQVACVLGVRQLAQAAATSRSSSQLVWKLGVGVDCAHALSALGLAVAQPRWRRAGVRVALIASAFAGNGMVRASRAGSDVGPVVRLGS